MTKKYNILWTGPALEDLRNIRNFVSLDKPTVAKKLSKSIKKKVLRLRDNPLFGRIVPELPDHEYREIIVAPYRIVYKVEKNRVVILRVWHSRQLIR